MFTFVLSLTMNVWLRCLVTSLFLYINYTTKKEEKDPTIYLKTPEIIRLNGYPVEEHLVTSQDGYVIEIHRIPYGKRKRLSDAYDFRPPVFLQHGSMCSSADWVIIGSDGLAYLLADSGYDVWLGNTRGNTYGNKHIHLKPEDPKFWKFSIDEMGIYDLPAEIDYILLKTQQSTLTFVGHSMGCAIFFAMTSSKPEYNNKINLMVALAPVVFVDHVTSPTGIGKYFPETSKAIVDILGVNSFLSRNFCSLSKATQNFCRVFYFYNFGYNPLQMNISQVPTISHHTPDGLPARLSIHYTQMMKSGKFHQFDFGKWGNILKYGSLLPPEYNLGRVSVPVALYWSESDMMTQPKDLNNLKSKLPEIIYEHRVPLKSFNHVDFMYARHVKMLLYDDVLRIVDKYGVRKYPF